VPVRNISAEEEPLLEDRVRFFMINLVQCLPPAWHTPYTELGRRPKPKSIHKSIINFPRPFHTSFIWHARVLNSGIQMDRRQSHVGEGYHDIHGIDVS